MSPAPRRALAGAGALAAAALLATLGLAQDRAGPPEPPERTIRRLIHAQMAALNAEDARATLATFHPQAPGLAEQGGGLEQLFAARDVVYELEELHFVAADGPWAYARTVHSSQDPDRGGTKVRREQLLVFRSGGPQGWGFWTSVDLDRR